MKIEPYFIVIFVINGNSSVNYPIGLHTDVLKNVLYIYTLWQWFPNEKFGSSISELGICWRTLSFLLVQ